MGGRAAFEVDGVMRYGLNNSQPGKVYVP